MKLLRNLLIVLSLSMANNAIAKTDFVCKLIVNKNTCWDQFEAIIQILDPYSTSQSVKEKLVIAKGKRKNTITFPCSARDSISLAAKFSPTIWKGREAQVYTSKNNWQVPVEIAEDATDWRINICFPEDFQSVPEPTGELRNCQCIKDNIVKIKLDQDGNELESLTAEQDAEREAAKNGTKK